MLQHTLTIAIQVLFFVPFILAVVNTVSKFSRYGTSHTDSNDPMTRAYELEMSQIIGYYADKQQHLIDVELGFLSAMDTGYSDREITAICTDIFIPQSNREDIHITKTTTVSKLYELIKEISTCHGLIYPSRYGKTLKNNRQRMIEYLSELPTM